MEKIFEFEKYSVQIFQQHKIYPYVNGSEKNIFENIFFLQTLRVFSKHRKTKHFEKYIKYTIRSRDIK